MMELLDLILRNLRSKFGAEDYIEIAKFCKFIIIENIPIFMRVFLISNRFITLIDVFYENRIKLMVSSKTSLEDISSASALEFILKEQKVDFTN